MARVPYSGTLEVAPSGQALPGVSGEIPAEAFGAGTAASLSASGAALERAGDELFQRAYAMQQLANESEAREAEAKYIVESGRLHADFNSLQGRAAYEAYPQYQKDLTELRGKIRGTLGNPMSQRLYDSATRTAMARTIFNGASHAASQNRKYALDTLENQIYLDSQQVEDDPQNEVLFQQTLGKVRQSAREIAALSGAEPGSPQEEVMVLKATSKATANRLIGLSRVKPFEASAALDKAKGLLTQEDFLRVDGTIRNQARAVGSANIADEVWDPDATLEQMEGEARTKANRQNPDDPILEKNAVAAVRGLYNQRKYADRQQLAEDREAVAGAIQQGVRNVQELRADPKVAAVIDRLPKSEQNGLQNKINAYNRSRDEQTDWENFQRLLGLAQNDPTGFTETDIMSEKLNRAQMDQLLKMQRQNREKAQGDPRVTRAMGWLKSGMGTQMEALGVFNRTQDNAKVYDQFTGALQSALDSWQEVHGKAPTYKDVMETIAPQLMQPRSYPGRFWGTNQYPMFDPPTYTAEYEAFSDRVKADVVSKGGVEPTEEQIMRAYIRTQYNTLYGTKKEQDRVQPR